jgi:hypothetical protein
MKANIVFRHCEQSEAIQNSYLIAGLLRRKWLAMTRNIKNDN